ncbi:hypothetical protein [Caldalkalibacillus mannanilyticus]|uniref:hypothetical protein n=1 Tax=Caldalkalibacillus mannanilyticus TaxID=1418 RepID=UPI00046A14E4|nr:hypothetical protein [Caldalkalibacillus mannanilyticus]
MITLKSYESNILKVENLRDLLTDTIKKMGYNFPMEEAKSEYQKTLGINCIDFKPEFGRRFFYEMNYLYGSSKGIMWSTFFKLSNEKDYCLITLIEDDETENKRSKTKRHKISLGFMSVDYNIDEIQKILDFLVENIRELDTWSVVQKKNEKFIELSQNYSSPVFSEEEYVFAKYFNDSLLSSIILTIKSSGSLLKRDLINKFEKIEDINKYLDSLKEQNLIRPEYVVLCKKTNEQITKSSKKESIDLMGEHDIRCSRCDRLITEETIEELLITTKISNNMIDGSRWMTINLVDALVALGVPLEDILVNIAEGPEEIDAIVSIGENLLLFELKDSQFSLGHAYPFQSRLVVYNAGIGVIWASRGVAPEVKEHFNRVKPEADICYIESLDEILPSLGKLIEGLRWKLATNELKSLISSGMVMFDLAAGIVEDLKVSNSALDGKKQLVAVSQDIK